MKNKRVACIIKRESRRVQIKTGSERDVLDIVNEKLRLTVLCDSVMFRRYSPMDNKFINITADKPT